MEITRLAGRVAVVVLLAGFGLRACHVNRATRLAVDDGARLTVDEGAMPYTIYTRAESVGEALHDAGITIYAGDRVQPGLGAPVSVGLKVFIQRSAPFSLWADGRWHKTRALSHTVGDALAESGIGLAGLDKVFPSLDTRLFPNMLIGIVRVREEIQLEEEITRFTERYVGDRNLPIDTLEVRDPGADGIKRRRYRVRYEDDQEVGRTLENEWAAQASRERVIAYGQKIVPQTFVDESGQEITYWRKITMRATSYSAGTAGVSPDMSWYGRTYTGHKMRKGVVAVDPEIIPLRSRVYVPDYGIGDALDTGSNIKRRRIALGYDDDNLVLWSQQVEVYLLWPPPPDDQIKWRLPD